MGVSTDYPNVPDWVSKSEGYKTGAMVKYKGNIFYANFWASEPGVGDANDNGWRFYDELYDQIPHTPTEQAKIIAYIPTWRKKEGFNYANGEMYQYITHGIVAFLMFSETNLGEFDPTSVNDVNAVLSDIVNTGHEKGTRISIALGGAVDYGFLNLMTSVGNNSANPLLDKAVQNVVNFVNSNALDGVDLDLECWWDKNNDANKDQGGRLKSKGPHPAGYALTLFAQKLKQAMPDKLVSATLFGTSWYGNNYDSKIADYVDWLAIMTYDLTGSWNSSPVGPHTALYKIRNQSDYAAEQQGAWPPARSGGTDSTPMVDNPILSVEDTLWYWTNPLFVNWQGSGQNIPRNKIAAGVPIYGYDFAYGKDPDDLSGQIAPGYKTIQYKDILSQFPDAHTAANGNIKVPGNTSRPPFISAAGTYPYAHNIYFETPKTAADKLNFLKNVGAQGVIIWELSNDVWEEGKSVIQSLYQHSGNPATRPAIPTTLPKPVGFMLSQVQQSETDSFISNLDIIEGENTEPPAGWNKVDVDLNKGAKGAYLYLIYQQSDNPESAIRGVKILEGNNTQPDVGWTRRDVNLNKGTGAKSADLYLSFTSNSSARGAGDTLRGIGVITSKDRVEKLNPTDPIYTDWSLVSDDLNKGAGGDYIYLIYEQGIYEQGLFITSLEIIDGKDTKPSAGFKKIDVDLNQGAGGDFLYLTYKRDKNPESAIRGIKILEGNNTQPDVGWTRRDVNLNKGTGTKTADLYLSFTSNSNVGNPITKISVIAHNSELKNLDDHPEWKDWQLIPDDLNKGARGNYIYIVYQQESVDNNGNWIELHGDNSYCYCACNSATNNKQRHASNHTMNIRAGAPYFYAVLTKDDDTVDFPIGAELRIEGPDGTKYDRDIQEDNQLVIMSGSSVRCLIVKDPKPGDWKMTMRVPEGVGYHCECNTVPSKDPYKTITTTLSNANRLQKRGSSYNQGWIGVAVNTIILSTVVTASAFASIPVILSIAAGVTLALIPIGMDFLAATMGTKPVALLSSVTSTPTTSQPSNQVSTTATAITSTAQSISINPPPIPQPVTVADALIGYVHSQNNTTPNDNDEQGVFEIYLQDGTRSRHTSYLGWIGEIRTYFGREVAVRLNIHDAQSPWIRMNSTNLYVEQISEAQNPWANGGAWRVIPEGQIRYDNALQANISVESIRNAIHGVNTTINSLRDGANPTTTRFNSSYLAILIFLSAEAVRFDGVAFAVNALLRGQVQTYQWQNFRPLLLGWSYISSYIYNRPEGEFQVGISILVSVGYLRSRIVNSENFREELRSLATHWGYPPGYLPNPWPLPLPSQG